MIFRAQLLLLVLLSFFSSGCSSLGLFGAQVSSVKTVAEPPSNITVFLTVKDAGKPVPHLAPENFEVYENDVLLDNDAIGLRLLPRREMAVGFTVLLLDLSGAPSKSELARIARGAANFVEKVSTTQAVTVVAFDGSERAREVARFERVDEPVKRPLPDLGKFLGPDTSRDLNSAFLAAIQGVNKKLAESPEEGKFGSVVTLVRGPDLAGRKSDNDVRNAVTVSQFDFYSMSPEGAKVPTLNALGEEDRFEYENIDVLPMRFSDLGMRVRNAWFGNYLVSYCSPARAGERKLKVKVNFEGEAGGTKAGSIRSEFDASQFTGGCSKEASPETSVMLEQEEQEPVAEPEEPKEEPQPEKKPVKKSRHPKKATPPPPPPEEPEDEEPQVVAPPSSGKYE